MSCVSSPHPPAVSLALLPFGGWSEEADDISDYDHIIRPHCIFAQAVVDSFHNLTNITNCDGTKICNEDRLLYFGFAGVFIAAFDSGIEWLIVKGIADYAHSSCAQQNTKRWRRCASVMAASLVMHILIIPLYSVPGHIIKVILTKASFRGYSCRPSNLFVVLVLFPLCYPQFFSLMDLSFKSKARGAEREAFPIPNYISQSLE